MRIFDWRRPIVFTHRWLGIACGLLFIGWFASGIVMMYARMPALDGRERAAGLPRLDAAAIRASAADAATYTGGSAERVRIGMLGDRPVYRLFSRGRWTTVFADTGQPLQSLSPDEALDAARRFAPDRAATIRYDARLTAPDQWTIENRALLPLHRIALGDQAGTHVYVSDQTAETILTTTRRSRRLGYAGAVVHWIYFTPFRRNGSLWSQFIIWTSMAGIMMCVTGLLWGVRQYLRVRSPYAGWMRWHHYAGLIFGATSLTFVFSGLLSMDPWDWHPSTAPTREQREAATGGALRLDGITPDRIQAAAAAFARPGGSDIVKELELLQFRGERYFRSAAGLVSATNPEPGIFTGFDRTEMEAVAAAAMPRVPVKNATWLTAYDAYYYDRAGELSLPVLRVRYDDPVQTWLYLDPRRGAIARKEERLTRVNRWLYHGFHSWDFPFLYYRRPLWDAVVITLSAGGLASAVTTLTPAWRRLRRVIGVRP